MRVRNLALYFLFIFQIVYLYFTYKQIVHIDKFQKSLKTDFYNINISFGEFSIIKEKINCSKELVLLFNPTEEEQKRLSIQTVANYAFAPCIPKVYLTSEVIRPSKDSFLIIENSHPGYKQIVSESQGEKIQLNHLTFLRW